MIVTIKARMQLKQSADASQQYKGTIAGLKKIIKEEGPQGLYKGNSLLLGISDGRRCSKINSVGAQCRISFHVQRSLFQLEQGGLAVQISHNTHCTGRD